MFANIPTPNLSFILTALADSVSMWKFAPKKCLICETFGFCGVGASRSIIETTNVWCNCAAVGDLMPKRGGIAVSADVEITMGC